jgi:hypothetical protein
MTEAKERVPCPWLRTGSAPVGSFRDYVMGRKYDFGRGRRESWQFIAFARGAGDFPNPNSWRELEAYVRRRGLTDEYGEPARAVWRSYTALRSRLRRSADLQGAGLRR